MQLLRSHTASQPNAANSGTDSLFTRFSRGFQALAVRNYRLYWIGQLISQTGTWMQRTAQDWIVLQMTHSPFALGVVTTLQFTPVLLLSLFGGVISDRFPKHKLVITTQTLALIQTAIFALLVATGTIQLWHIYILAAMQGTINAIDNPARQAFAVELVGREHLVNAVALNSMLFNASRIVGPALAGLLIAGFGIAPALYLNGISYLAVLAGLLMMDPAAFFAPRSKPSGPALRGMLDGLTYVRQTPTVMLVMIIVGAIGMFGYNFGVVLPLLAGFVLHTSAAGFGSLSAFLGLGSLVGAIATAYTRTITTRRLAIASGIFGFLLAGVALSTNLLLSAVLLIALGFAGVLFSTSANTLLQLVVPDEYRGRVMGLYMLLFAGSTPIGGLLIGSLSNSIGVSEALLICAVLCVVGVAIALVYRSRTEQASNVPASA